MFKSSSAFVYGEFSGLCRGWFYHTQWPSLLSIFCCRISTPRRFGKTIAVCLFVAALIFACPNVEISIYSTCERHPDMHFVCCVYARLHIHLFSGLACDVLTLNVSTGKRISQKLLRNCVKFLSIIHDVLKIAPMEYIKQSSDEVDIRGPESKYDSRKINSYPSKVRGGGLFSPQYTYFEITCAGQSQYMCLHALPHNTESADFHRMY